MPLGALLRKETLSDAQTYTDIKLDNEAVRMMRQIGENISGIPGRYLTRIQET